MAADSFVATLLDDSQRSPLWVVRTIDDMLRRSPNGDAPQLVEIKLACLAALHDLGVAAKVEERRCSPVPGLPTPE